MSMHIEDVIRTQSKIYKGAFLPLFWQGFNHASVCLWHLSILFEQCLLQMFDPADIYMFKVNNRNIRARCEICSKLTIKTLFWCLY